MKRFFASLFAVVLLLVGASLAAAGGLGLSIFGTDGAYEAPSSSLDSDPASVAIIADLASVEVDIPFSDLLGEITLSVESPDGTAMFVGRAAQEQVDGYLFGQPYDLATREDTWVTVHVPGVETTVAPPAEQTFWKDDASGAAASIDLDEGAQNETLVFMNADGSPGITVDFWLGFEGVNIFAYSVLAITVGVVFILLAVTILVRGFTRRRGAAGPESSDPDPDSEIAAQAQHPAT